jgi:hypothetical protein
MPILPYLNMGGITCEGGAPDSCEACIIDASALMLTFLLNRSTYSEYLSADWEKEVFFRNVKSFNYAMGTNYNVNFDGPLSGLSYNFDLVYAIQNYTSQNPNLIKLKADCIAERSFDDNIDSMFRKNKAVIVAAFIFIFLYIALALGYFPSTVQSRFSLALVSISVIALSFVSACGTTFYWD